MLRSDGRESNLRVQRRAEGEKSMNKHKLEIFSLSFVLMLSAFQYLNVHLGKGKGKSSHVIQGSCKVSLKNIPLHTYPSPFYCNPSADSHSLRCLGQIKYSLYHWGVVELSFVRHFEAGKC